MTLPTTMDDLGFYMAHIIFTLSLHFCVVRFFKLGREKISKIAMSLFPLLGPSRSLFQPPENQLRWNAPAQPTNQPQSLFLSLTIEPSPPHLNTQPNSNQRTPLSSRLTATLTSFASSSTIATSSEHHHRRDSNQTATSHDLFLPHPHLVQLLHAGSPPQTSHTTHEQSSQQPITPTKSFELQRSSTPQHH